MLKDMGSSVLIEYISNRNELDCLNEQQSTMSISQLPQKKAKKNVTFNRDVSVCFIEQDDQKSQNAINQSFRSEQIQVGSHKIHLIHENDINPTVNRISDHLEKMMAQHKLMMTRKIDETPENKFCKCFIF